MCVKYRPENGATARRPPPHSGPTIVAGVQVVGFAGGQLLDRAGQLSQVVGVRSVVLLVSFNAYRRRQ